MSRGPSRIVGFRNALAGLTLRGRAFLAAGTTAIACAIVLGQSALVRVGVLVVVLPLAAAFFTGLRRTGVTLERSLLPRVVTAGQPARVDLRVANGSGGSPGALLVEDLVPYALGTRSRFVLQGLGRRWERQVSYQVRSDVRGGFEVGPLTVRLTDPFGLIEMRRTLPGRSTLVVTPRTVDLPRIPLGGGWSGAGDQRPQSFAAGSAEDVSVREYRRGDELRRVHWRSSARVGELMVRREEQPWESHVTVLLDNRLRVHRGQGLASSFETAVGTAASVVAHFERLGYAVRLVTAEGNDADGADHQFSHLERLALTTTTQAPYLDAAWAGEHERGGIVVGVFGATEPTDRGALSRIRHHSGTAVAVVLDVEQWSERLAEPGAPSPTTGVTGAGWRSVTLGPRDRLDAVWRDLGRLAGASALGATR